MMLSCRRIFSFALLLITFAVLLSTTDSADYRPVVLWHGMGDTCCDPLSMGRIKRMIEKAFEGIYVYSIEVGNDVIEDKFNSFFMNVNDQIVQVQQKLANQTELSAGFNAIGFSQGGQFLRGYIERYNNPPVYNLISIGGQHQGVFGFPNCPTNDTDCQELAVLLRLGAYDDYVQSFVAQAEYWKDPYHLTEYLEKSVFLADINNERTTKNQTYKENLITLDNFVMVKFLNDTMVAPKESEWFSFYVADQDVDTIPLNQSEIYLQDWIGLKTLDEANKLHFIPCDGNHLQFTDVWFEDNVYPFLNNTFTNNSAALISF